MIFLKINRSRIPRISVGKSTSYFRLSGNFNITVSNSNNEVFKSPDSVDFKTETELSKKVH